MIKDRHVFVVKSTEDQVIRVFKDIESIVRYYNLGESRCTNYLTNRLKDNGEIYVIHNIVNYISAWTCCVDCYLTIRYMAKMCYTLCDAAIPDGEKLEILKTSII